MNKKLEAIIHIRYISWIIGVDLSLVSKFIFSNNNDLVWSITFYYSVIIAIISCAPICEVFLIMDLINKKKKIVKHLLYIVSLPLCLIVYAFAFVWCTGV